jgi:hypothetical protein
MQCSSFRWWLLAVRFARIGDARIGKAGNVHAQMMEKDVPSSKKRAWHTLKAVRKDWASRHDGKG